jgi:hypothetical protein
MADAQTRKAAIKKASYRVRTGGAFVRRASAKVIVKPSSVAKKAR